MPLMYGDGLGALQTTNATPSTENDAMFLKPGSTRVLWLLGIQISGKANALTAISGITARIKKWFTTSSSGGTAITPSPKDPGYQAAKHTAGAATGAVTSGTGGPTFMGFQASCGVAGPGAWAARDMDSAPSLEGAANMSLDVFVAAPTASLNYELTAETAE